MCLAYQEWYNILYPGKNLAPDEKPQVLCTTHTTLDQEMTCAISDALAQTSWIEKELKGRIHVDSA